MIRKQAQGGQRTFLASGGRCADLMWKWSVRRLGAGSTMEGCEAASGASRKGHRERPRPGWPTNPSEWVLRPWRRTPAKPTPPLPTMLAFRL